MAFPRPNHFASQRLKTQKGFALVLTLALMPLLMAALIAYLLLNTSLQTWMETSHICRKELLKTQDTAAAGLEKLLAMNSSVKLIRSQILVTEIAIAAAVASAQVEALPPLRE